jgi:hypothetical protein
MYSFGGVSLRHLAFGSFPYRCPGEMEIKQVYSFRVLAAVFWSWADWFLVFVSIVCTYLL